MKGETQPAGTGPLEDPVTNERIRRDGDRTGRMARAIGERLGARRALCAEGFHNGPAHLTSAPFERWLPPAGRLAVRPATRNRQWDASGQSPQRGAGRQKTRPRSINAWFQFPGAEGSSQAWASRASRSGRTSSGSTPWITRAVILRTLVSTAATGSPYPIDATAAAVYGPTPGSRRRASPSLGTRPS